MFHILNQQDIIYFSSFVYEGDHSFTFDVGIAIVFKVDISSSFFFEAQEISFVTYHMFKEPTLNIPLTFLGIHM